MDTEKIAKLIDHSLLHPTLTDNEFKFGMAEILKAAIIKDEKLFNYLEQNSALIFERNRKVLGKVIAQSIMMKKQVIEKDEKESNFRKILNCRLFLS